MVQIANHGPVTISLDTPGAAPSTAAESVRPPPPPPMNPTFTPGMLGKADKPQSMLVSIQNVRRLAGRCPQKRRNCGWHCRQYLVITIRLVGRRR
eukprot:COSAG01_NODE_425_length_17240_cov_29.899306_7_plen_95_part_00